METEMTLWKSIKDVIDRIFEGKIYSIWWNEVRCEPFREWEDRCLNFPSLKFIPEAYHKIILKVFGSEKNLNYHYFWLFTSD